VLDRYYQVARTYGAKHVARITADCPLIDPAVIDRVAREYEKGDCDYISTGRIVSTFPDGMDTEIFSFSALEIAWKEAKLASEREHVTPFIWNHPERFKVREIKNDVDRSAIRLTVDEERDYILIQDVVAHASDLSMEGIIAYLAAHSDIATSNASIVRDEGYQKSLDQDEKA
jgi:spore coat polysaccharide biosynthesis protein SpsF